MSNICDKIDKDVYKNHVDKRNKQINFIQYLYNYLQIIDSYKEHATQLGEKKNNAKNLQKEKLISVYKSFEPYEKTNPMCIKNLFQYCVEIFVPVDELITRITTRKRSYFIGLIKNIYNGDVIGAIFLGNRHDETYKSIYIVISDLNIGDTDEQEQAVEIFNELIFVKSNVYTFYKSYLRDVVYSVIRFLYENNIYFKNIIVIGKKQGAAFSQLICADLAENFQIFKKHLGDRKTDVKITTGNFYAKPFECNFFYKNMLERETLIPNTQCDVHMFLVCGDNCDSWNEISSKVSVIGDGLLG